MIGRLHHVVIDAPEPLLLARFYSELLGLPVTYESDDWVVIARNDTSSGVAFQRAANHIPPRWPDPNWPQQFHFDVMADDLTTADRQVLAIGARRLPAGDQVYVQQTHHTLPAKSHGTSDCSGPCFPHGTKGERRSTVSLSVQPVA